MSKLDFEQRHRLETEVLPAVVSDPEYAAATIVRLEARVAELEAAREKLIASYYDVGEAEWRNMVMDALCALAAKPSQWSGE